jgi:flagellin-specific chaperone FliS
VPLVSRGTFPDIIDNVISKRKGVHEMDLGGPDAYKTNQAMSASPGQLVLLLYDHVIKCLKKSDMEGASRGIVELMGSLDLDYEEVSGRLFSLYEYCLDLVKNKEYEQAHKVLTEMRHMWATAISKMVAETSSTGSGREMVDVKS